jgi:hypothetical protein
MKFVSGGTEVAFDLDRLSLRPGERTPLRDTVGVAQDGTTIGSGSSKHIETLRFNALVLSDAIDNLLDFISVTVKWHDSFTLEQEAGESFDFGAGAGNDVTVRFWGKSLTPVSAGLSRFSVPILLKVEA